MPYPPFPHGGPGLRRTAERQESSRIVIPDERGLSEPILPPEEDRDDLMHTVQAQATSWQPALAWGMGAIGAGLCQAAVAVSARPDAGVAQLSTAGTAMAAGTWMYGQGVAAAVKDALDGEGLGSASVAAASYTAVILGIGLTTVSNGPARMAGVGMAVMANIGLHFALTDGFLRAMGRLGEVDRLRDQGSVPLKRSQGAIVLLAVISILGSAIAVSSIHHLGPVEAAAAALFCHSLFGTCSSAFFGLRRWRKEQNDASPRRPWNDAPPGW